MSEQAAPRIHRVVAGACLMATPLLFAAAELSAPEADGGNARSQLDAMTGHHAAVVLTAYASLAMTMTLLVGTLATVGAVRRGRGALLMVLAGTCIVFGAVTAHAGLAGANLVISEAATPGQDRTSMLVLLDTVFHDTAGAPLLLGHLVFTLGILLLGLAVWRSRIAPTWVGVCLMLFPIADVLLSGVPVEHLADVVSNLFGVVGFAGLGVAMVRDGAESPATSQERRELALNG